MVVVVEAAAAGEKSIPIHATYRLSGKRIRAGPLTMHGIDFHGGSRASTATLREEMTHTKSKRDRIDSNLRIHPLWPRQLANRLTRGQFNRRCDTQTRHYDAESSQLNRRTSLLRYAMRGDETMLRHDRANGGFFLSFNKSSMAEFGFPIRPAADVRCGSVVYHPCLSKSTPMKIP